MELGLIIAIVGSAIAIIGVMTAIFLWVRTEANSDRREFQNIQREDRKDLITLIRAIETEMKDFHQMMEKHDAELKSFLMNRVREGK